MATAKEEERRYEALKMSLESYESLPAVTTETIVGRAAAFETYLKEGKTK